MDKQAILRYLGEDWTRTEEMIRSSLASDIALLNDTNASFLEHSGKKLRPIIALIVAKVCGNGAITADSVRYAAAAELMHNATLFHDDVVDGSTMRRGVPTVSSILGSSASVLIGDFWLSRAMVDIISSDQQKGEVTRTFAKTLADLAEGEMLQLQKAANGDTSEADYMRIIYSKTASLFEATCVTAAMSVDASDEVIAAVRKYAVNIGLAFQIKDDILDYIGADIGKPTGADVKEGKITLPLLGALHNVGDEKEKTVRTMVCQVEEHPRYVDMILNFVKEMGGIEYANERLYKHCRIAKDQLEIFPPSEGKKLLSALAEYIADRNL